jgi:hypothetical protein
MKTPVQTCACFPFHIIQTWTSIISRRMKQMSTQVSKKLGNSRFCLIGFVTRDLERASANFNSAHKSRPISMVLEVNILLRITDCVAPVAWRRLRGTDCVAPIAWHRLLFFAYLCFALLCYDATTLCLMPVIAACVCELVSAR